MNVKNNRRRQASVEKITSAFMALLEEKPLNRITVSEICQATGLNRSTFYANFPDVYALADQISRNLEKEIEQLYQGNITEGFSSHGSILLFRHIRDHQTLYKTYFKLDPEGRYPFGYDAALMEELLAGENPEYHVAFFYSGFNAMVRLWLEKGCRESPEEMMHILQWEYRGRLPEFRE